MLVPAERGGRVRLRKHICSAFLVSLRREPSQSPALCFSHKGQQQPQGQRASARRFVNAALSCSSSFAVSQRHSSGCPVSSPPCAALPCALALGLACQGRNLPLRKPGLKEPPPPGLARMLFAKPQLYLFTQPSVSQGQTLQVSSSEHGAFALMLLQAVTPGRSHIRALRCYEEIRRQIPMINDAVHSGCQ